jgi:magnesium-transporting ATPase (P-type)
MSIFSIRALRRPIWFMNPFGNKYLLMAVSGSFIFLLLGVYWSPLQVILDTSALDSFGWVTAFLVGLISIFLIELVKVVFTRRTPLKIFHENKK